MNKPFTTKFLPTLAGLIAMLSLALALPRLLNTLGRKWDRIEFGHKK